MTATGRRNRLVSQLLQLGRLTGGAAWQGFVGFYNSDNLTYAASISYYALLSLFPFLLLMLSLMGSATAHDGDRTTVLSFVLRYFPTRFEFVTRQLDSFYRTRVQLGVVGVLSLTWAALGIFGAISAAVNHAWGVERQRSYLGHKLFAFFMLLAAGGILLVALVLVSAAQVAEASWFAAVLGRFPGLSVLHSFTIRHAATALLIVVLALIYYFVPNTTVRFADVWIGAIVAGLLWRAATAGFSWYIRDMSRFTLVHGSIATVVVFLVWVYLSAVIVLYGVEFTAAFGRLRRERTAATSI